MTLEKNFKESSILIRGGVCQYPQPQSRWYGQTTQDYKDKDKYFPISVTSLINLFSFAKYETLYDFDIVLIKADGSKKSEEDGFSREGGGGYMRTGNTQWRKVKGAQGHM